jgi:predicted SnoaL-like aldol condensation-catalyzing enzyme
MTTVATNLETRAAIERFNEAVARKDVEALRAAITADCIFESPAPPDGKRYVGSSMVDVFAKFFALDGEGPFDVEEIFTAGDRAIVRWTHPWEHSDGERGHVRGIDVFRVVDGKVAEKLSYVKG